jgi:hypothetical protein
VKPDLSRPIDQSPQKWDVRPTTQTLKNESPEALADFIRRFAATGAGANELYSELATLGLKDRPWWRTADEASTLLDLASDLSVSEPYRVVAMGIYLASAPQPQLSQNSDSIQQIAIDSTDSMATTVLQGMADRSLTSATLTKDILSRATSGIGVKCYAWYAARRTQTNNTNLAATALAAADSGMSEASKVAFDYLANGSFTQQYTADVNFQQKTDELLAAIQSLSTTADPIALANGDAFIRAIPSITPAKIAIDSLFALAHEAQNPEMRLSAIEQLVSLHRAGTQDLSKELHEIRNQIAVLFSDPVKQARAKKRLNRAIPAPPEGARP